jgi:hypothetical protein
MSRMFSEAYAFKGKGVANLQLIKQPIIAEKFSSSGVPKSENNALIWNKWQKDYGYTTTLLAEAGLIDPSLPIKKEEKKHVNTISLNLSLKIRLN